MTVGRLNEAIGVDLTIGRQVTNQTNVWTFRGLNRANAAIVRLVYVTYIKACAVARETTGTQGRETALVTDLRQGIDLVHKLRQLAATEELFHRGHDRADVDK